MPVSVHDRTMDLAVANRKAIPRRSLIRGICTAAV